MDVAIFWVPHMPGCSPWGSETSSVVQINIVMDAFPGDQSDGRSAVTGGCTKPGDSEGIQMVCISAALKSEVGRIVSIRSSLAQNK